MLRSKNGMFNNTKIASKTANNIDSSNTSNYQITKKQHDKNKKQIELKSKIDIPIDDHNRAIKKEKIKQLVIKEEPQNHNMYNQTREESKRGNNISKSKEKVHKKTLSEIPKTISNLDTSEQEDDDDVMISVSYNNRLHNKNTKFMNLKKKNEALTNENDSLFEEKIKKNKINGDYSKTDINNNNNSKGYNLLNYSKQISPFLKPKRPTSENNISSDKMENLMTDDAFMKDQRYLQLLEKCNYISAEYITMKNNENDYRKSVDLLTNIIKIQNNRINDLIDENIRIKSNSHNSVDMANKEREAVYNQINYFKSLVLKLYSKMSNLETEDIERTNAISKLSMQLLKENEYLRKGMQSVLGNSLNKEFLNNENKPIEKNPIPVKKKRNPTQINFDFLDKESLESNNKSEETINNEVNKLVQDFKLNKKSKTLKPVIEPPVEKSTNNSSSTTIENGNYLSKKLDSHQTNIKPRQHYLFPKTPNNEDKKNFDFKNSENKEENINK